MVLDWLYSPYCSAGWIAREAAEIYGLKLNEWKLSEIKDAGLVMLPMHITKAVKDIRNDHHHTRIQGAEPQFFLDRKPIGIHQTWESLSSALESAGLKPSRELRIPETLTHPRLDSNRDDPAVMVKPVTQRDIAGQGLPSPTPCIDSRFGELGSPEVVEFLNEKTRQYGRAMSIAFIGAEVAGYITHFPKPVCWRIGCRHVTNVQDIKTLQIIDFYVYPKFRDREDVKEKLLVHTHGFGKKSRLNKIEVFASTKKPENPDEEIATGDMKPYLDFGFLKKREVVPVNEKSDDLEEKYGITNLTFSI
ncbi:MAG: hypothetical protein R2883_02035 [Caldisericia bacterium]